MKKINTKNLILSGLFLALIAIGSYIKIPIFYIPFSLQFLCVLITAQVLPPKYSAITLLSYMLAGLLGLPVFAGGGGVGYIAQPSFGYIIGFLFAAPVISFFSHKGKVLGLFRLFINNLIGMLIVYIFGISYFCLLEILYFGNHIDFYTVFCFGFLVFLPLDVGFCFITPLLTRRLKNKYI